MRCLFFNSKTDPRAAIGIGTLPEQHFNTVSYYTDWLDTGESQRLLDYQRDTFEDQLAGPARARDPAAASSDPARRRPCKPVF